MNIPPFATRNWTSLIFHKTIKKLFVKIKKEFVENYTHGWEPFVKRVNEYPLDKVEEITWVPKEKIREAARLFAVACILSSRATRARNDVRRSSVGLETM